MSEPATTEKNPQSQSTPENKPSENPTEENILKQYEDLSPISFVDTIERYYHTFLPNQNKNNLNILSSYKTNTNVKFQLVDFITKKNLSSKIQPILKNITCLKLYGDTIIFGDTTSAIYIYSIEKEAELKTLKPPGNNIDYYATSIDVSPLLDFCLVGYSNGLIHLWDLTKYNILYTIKDIFTTKIMVVQFSQIIEKKKFEIISTDLSGKLLKLILTISFFKKSVQDVFIYKDDVPTFAITQFKPLKTKSIVLAAFCNTNKIRVYILRPILCSFFEINRPNNIVLNEKNLPDISFGWGYEPSENDIDSSQTKLNELIKQNQIMLAVSWGQVIKLYSMNIKGEDIVLNGDGPISYFINDAPVVRLGFISPSIIYFFDKNAQMKIINTAYTQYGDFTSDKKEDLVYNKKAIVDEGKIIDPNLLKIDISGNNSQLFCYRYFISNMNKCIYLCTEKEFYIGKVLNFDECIYNLVKQDNWLGAMCLSIDIYQGNITSFPDIPVTKVKRKELLGPFLIDLLNKYIRYHLEEKCKDDKLTECASVVIEFCIGIKDINYLFKSVEKEFRSKGKNDIFYNSLELFIFNDLLNQDSISEESLITLYTTYKSENNLPLLSHLYTHINFKCLFNQTFKKISFKDNMFSLMILLFSNCKNYQYFFLPIAKMYKIFESKYKQNENLCSNIDNYGKDHLKGITLMEESTEYIGHKLLWFIDMSLKGKKFSLGMDVSFLKFDTSSNEYINFVALIFYWILQNDVFTNLMKFDSYSFFSALSLFLTDNTLMNIIKNYDFTQINTKYLEKIKNEEDITFLNDDKFVPEPENTEDIKLPIEYNNLNAVVNYIIKLVEKEKGFFINIDLGLLLLKYATKCNDRSPIAATIKKQVIENYKKCISFYDDYAKLKESDPKSVEDIFNCHKVKKFENKSKIEKNKNSFYKELYKCLRDLLDYQPFKWRKDDLNNLLNYSKDCPFTLVKIKLYEFAKNFSECLDNYLDSNNIEIFSEDVFSFLQRIFQSFLRKNEDLNELDYKNLQQAVINNIAKLAKISVTKTNKIIKQFYGNAEKIIIIHKLDDSPELQYEFVKQLVSPSRGGRLEEMNLKDESENNIEKIEESSGNVISINDPLSDLLLLQIDLLIKLKKYNEILPNVKEQMKIYYNIYPTDKCLQKCLDNNIIDTAVLIYMSEGETYKAINLAKSSTEKTFNEFLQNPNDSEKYNEFLKNLNLGIKICQDISESIKNNTNNSKDIKTNEDVEKMWFNLLKLLHDFQQKCEKNSETEKKILENINDLLRKMCLNVRLRNIIETVTDMEQDSKYKEFKHTLGDMLRSNNSFNRILDNTMTILKNCIIKSEDTRKTNSMRGNFYNYDKCDVCGKLISDYKCEVLTCFGCGHQSHSYCTYYNNITGKKECYVCRQSEICNEYRNQNDDEENDNNVTGKDNENVVENDDKKKEDENENQKEEVFWYGNKNDKINNMISYDQRYVDMLGEI